MTGAQRLAAIIVFGSMAVMVGGLAVAVAGLRQAARLWPEDCCRWHTSTCGVEDVCCESCSEVGA